MNQLERELHTARLLSGRIFIPKPFNLIIRRATPQQKARSVEAWARAYRRGQRKGLRTFDESVQLLVERKLWGMAEEAELERVTKDIDTIKCALYENRGKLAEVKICRRQLVAAKEKLGQLSSAKSLLYNTTVDAYATSVRTRTLIAQTLYDKKGKPIWEGGRAWGDRTRLLDRVISIWMVLRPTEVQIRELARTNPWRTYWNCRDTANGLFPGPASSLSDDQKSLVSWTRVYDNAASAEASQDIIDDDDIFDGWALSRQKNSNDGDILAGRVNERTRNSDEVFIFTQPEDGDEDEVLGIVDKLNTPAAKATINKRFAKIDKFGAVNEHQLPGARIERVGKE